MHLKYSPIWQWFLTIYSIYLVIDLFLKFATGFPSNILWSVIFAGNLLSIFLIYRFNTDNKINFNRPLRFLILGIYTLFVALNTLGFSVVITSYFWNYLSETPEIIMDIIGLIFPIFALYPVTKILFSYKLKKRKLMFYIWMGYLWLILILLIIAFPFVVMEISKWTFYDYLVNISLVLFLFGLFSYLIKRTFLNKKIWKWYFWISIVWTVVDIFYEHFLKEYLTRPDYLKSYSNEPINSDVYLILLLIFLPTYYPLYKIAFDKNFFKKN